MGTHSTTPRRKYEVIEVLGKVMHPHFGSSYHPTVWIVIVSVKSIIRCDVLQISSRRIQSQTTIRCHVTETDATRGFVRSTHCGKR